VSTKTLAFMERVPIQFGDFTHVESCLHQREGFLHGAFVIVFRRRKLLNLAGKETAD